MKVAPMGATGVQRRARTMSVSEGHKGNIRALVPCADKKQTHLRMGLGGK
jgi:hypothetical protein